MADLREWIEALSEADSAPTVGSMKRRSPRRGAERIKTARRADKHNDQRTDHDIAAELRRLHTIARRHAR